MEERVGDVIYVVLEFVSGLIFRGKISSPVVWSEGDRTVSFNIISQIEDAEIGFSPEEGQFCRVRETHRAPYIAVCCVNWGQADVRR